MVRFVLFIWSMAWAKTVFARTLLPSTSSTRFSVTIPRCSSPEWLSWGPHQDDLIDVAFGTWLVQPCVRRVIGTGIDQCPVVGDRRRCILCGWRHHADWWIGRDLLPIHTERDWRGRTQYGCCETVSVILLVWSDIARVSQEELASLLNLISVSNSLFSPSQSRPQEGNDKQRQ